MVTIEQKLTLFSKLLNQDIKEEVDQKRLQLDKEYEIIIAENKSQVDKQAAELIDQFKRRAESKRIELISKGKMSTKKECMLAKERLVTKFIDALIIKVNAFTASEAYRTYLEKSIKEIDSLKDYANHLVVCITQNDFDTNKEFIRNQLIEAGINPNKLSFEVGPNSMLGGIIIKDLVLNLQIDGSIATVIEESKDRIVEMITGAIGEAGDTLE